jgi:hypothetical protein
MGQPQGLRVGNVRPHDRLDDPFLLGWVGRQLLGARKFLAQLSRVCSSSRTSPSGAKTICAYE